MESLFRWLKPKEPDDVLSKAGAKVVRVKVKFGVLCMQQDGSVAFQIKTRDISEFNMGFRSKIPLVKGEKVKILIQSPLDYTTLTINGRVIYLDGGKKGFCGIIEFSEMSESDRNKLKKAVEKYRVH
jgi:hypothetical protein